MKGQRNKKNSCVVISAQITLQVLNVICGRSKIMPSSEAQNEDIGDNTNDNNVLRSACDPRPKR